VQHLLIYVFLQCIDTTGWVQACYYRCC